MHPSFKILADPVHGFVSVPRRLLLPLIQTPEVQRLRRIRQLGVGHLVFPSADHSRFSHALGAMGLMQEALKTLAEKGTPIAPEETQAALAAALLHDVGHGPFSHTLERDLIEGFHHEAMSRVLMADLNARFDGALELALSFFDDTYERPFFHQLLSSQLDMDRLDYLRRDSYFTGVVEGQVGVARLLKTMRVHPLEGGPDSRVVMESKGVYAVESFLTARRLMYWQVYLHKAVLSGDHLLRNLFARVRRHFDEGRGEQLDGASPSLLFFLRERRPAASIREPSVREAFCQLDDTDVYFSLKQWRTSRDPVLADLSRRFLDRDFFRVRFLDHEPGPAERAAWGEAIRAWISEQGLARAGEPPPVEAYLTVDTSRHEAYADEDEAICVIDQQGRVRELSETTDTPAIAALKGFVVKPYVCYPKSAEARLQFSGAPSPAA